MAPVTDGCRRGYDVRFGFSHRFDDKADYFGGGDAVGRGRRMISSNCVVTMLTLNKIERT